MHIKTPIMDIVKIMLFSTTTETIDQIFSFREKKIIQLTLKEPFSKIPHQIFAKLYTQLKINLNDKNQLKILLTHTIRVISAIRPWCRAGQTFRKSQMDNSAIRNKNRNFLLNR